MNERPRLAGVELGGTKSIALLASGTAVLAQETVPTTTPEETLSHLHRQLTRWYADEPFRALGIASFGPLQLDRASADYGSMLRTPKPHWSGAAIATRLTAGLDCPSNIDTDVNGAALAEHRWGAGQGTQSLCYITIGTGLGGGLAIRGRPVHGAMHPEMGHLQLRRAEGDTFAGICPFHGDCIEGLVSGPALAARFGGPADSVADSHPGWHHVISDLAELCATIMLTTSAQKILIGGGVAMARPFLLPMVRQRVLSRLEGYLPYLDAEAMEAIIRLPGLGSQAGPRGALALAHDAIGI